MHHRIAKLSRIAALAIASLLAVPSCSEGAQTQSALATHDAEPPRFELSGSEVHSVKATGLNRSYDVYVKLPPGYARDENASRRYPVIYLNDAGYNWVTAVGVTRAPFNHGGFEHAILVGISYSEGDSGAVSRIRDYTPTRAASWTQYETGGAREYLGFVRDDLIPFVEGKYRTHGSRRMLVGHSLGGLFGSFVMLEEPGLFSDYILSSPSLWFDNEAILDLEEAAHSRGVKPTGRVFFGVGSTETPAINNGSHDMVGQQRTFAERLRSRGYENLTVRDVVYEDATHLTTFPLALTQGLRWLLPGDDIYGG